MRRGDRGQGVGIGACGENGLAVDGNHPQKAAIASSKSDPVTDTDPTLSLLAYLCDNPNNVDLWRSTDLVRAAQGPVHRHRYEKISTETNSTLTLT